MFVLHYILVISVISFPSLKIESQIILFLFKLVRTQTSCQRNPPILYAFHENSTTEVRSANSKNALEIFLPPRDKL